MLAAANERRASSRLLRRAERQSLPQEVGSEYPQPRVSDKGRRLWLRDDLDQAILPPDLQQVRDVAEDL